MSGVGSEEGFDGEILEQIPANNNDRLFELTNKTSEDRVIYTFAVPKAVLGIEPEGGMFNVEQEESAHNSYNVFSKLCNILKAFLNRWQMSAACDQQEKNNIVRKRFTKRLHLAHP